MGAEQAAGAILPSGVFAGCRPVRSSSMPGLRAEDVCVHEPDLLERQRQIDADRGLPQAALAAPTALTWRMPSSFPARWMVGTTHGARAGDRGAGWLSACLGSFLLTALGGCS